ncbi:MAG: Ger(x)C family spore germination protein [Paenisporosarcina sp.]
MNNNLKLNLPKFVLLVSIIFLAFVFLMGCERYKVVNKINIADTIGFDVDKENEKELLGGNIIHQYQSGKEEGSPKATFSKGDSAEDAIAGTYRKSAFPIEIGKTRVLVFSEEFIQQKTLKDIMTTFDMNVKFGTNMKVIISKEPIPFFFDNILKQEDNKFLFNLIDQNMTNNNIPYSNLHIFLFDYYGEGRDPFLPYVSIENGEITLTNVGIIGREDKLQMLLGTKESWLLKLIVNDSKELKYTIPIHKDGKEGILSFNHVFGDSKITINPNENSLKIDLTTNSMIVGQPHWLNSKKDNNLIKEEVENFLIKNYIEMFKEFQKNDVDPIGVGDSFRSKDRSWNEKEFYKTKYPNLDVDFNVSFHLLN